MGRVRPAAEFENVEELLEAFGGIDARRIRMKPLPGTATEADVVRHNERLAPPCELINGTMVEKDMGFGEGLLGGDLFYVIKRFALEHGLGEVGPGDTMMKLMPGLVRLPDVCFISKARLPGGRRPAARLPELVPDLVVEVLSKGNTRGEMFQKRKDYFLAGVLLVWEVDARRREIDVYTDPKTCATLTEADTLTGGAVLPGFSVPVMTVFAEVPRAEPKPPRKRKK